MFLPDHFQYHLSNQYLTPLIHLTLTSGQISCVPCPAGSYCQSGTAIQCSAGTYSAEGASSCTPCDAGFYATGKGKGALGLDVGTLGYSIVLYASFSFFISFRLDKLEKHPFLKHFYAVHGNTKIFTRKVLMLAWKN